VVLMNISIKIRTLPSIVWEKRPSLLVFILKLYHKYYYKLIKIDLRHIYFKHFNAIVLLYEVLVQLRLGFVNLIGAKFSSSEKKVIQCSKESENISIKASVSDN